jgi:uncharacterized protein with HEPN domain
MKHPERIEDYLEHIAEASVRATEYIQHLDSAAALERDHKTQAAVIRNIEIIGEAANRIQNKRRSLWPPILGCHGRKCAPCVTG